MRGPAGSGDPRRTGLMRGPAGAGDPRRTGVMRGPAGSGDPRRTGLMLSARAGGVNEARANPNCPVRAVSAILCGESLSTQPEENAMTPDQGRRIQDVMNRLTQLRDSL